jgi:hypothetical protein
VPATTPRRWTRRLTALAAAAALPLLSACSVFSPATTAVPYNASDGVNVDLGQLHGSNLLVVGTEQGGQGVLSGALFNKGTEDLTVAVSTQGAPTPVEIEVPAQRMVRLVADSATASGATGSANTDASVLVPSLPVAPGAVMTVQIATRPGGQTQITVPVVPAQHEYATITAPPSATPTSPATQAPTSQPTASATESAEPTTSPS